ncbi:MarR family transcriptional regulator [Streptomyces sp. NPDC010273]|uniref:MarR family winged helix-turn-helix transcriptional regulator n=1 Tax=Streptomyces sp. NPDC010273 TaxID=3364829 RepID=UPI0036E6311A
MLIRLARSEGEELMMSSLADQIALTTSGVTRLVHRMQVAGYVERRPCPTDRRVSYAGIIATGRDVLDRAAVVHARNLRKVFEGFIPQDLAALDTALDHVREGASGLPRRP